MRSWLAVFLLVLLPLQFSWAVAGTPAPHEGQPVAAVHCIHPHGDACAAHADCGTCHNGCPLALFHEPAGHLPGAAAFPLTVAAVLPASRPGDLPDRPQWATRG